jgi:UDP-glucose 4-epimerase
MKLLVTGGTGFIGSHVIAAGLDDGHEVLALLRTPCSKPAIMLPEEPKWITGSYDELRHDDLRGVDALLHLASAGVSPKHATWEDLIDTNVAGSLKLYRIALDSGVKRYVVSGTCYEYGNSARRYNPIPPDAPLEPISPYAASKAAGYHLARAFAIEHELKLVYGRIFSAYGEGQYIENFWPSLRKAALNNEDFPMTSGRSSYDFIPVRSVARHLLEACIRPDVVSGSPLVVNIGTGKSSTLIAFAEKQWEQLNARGRILQGFLPDRSDDIDHYAADISGLNFR